jgi:hypothetical protein
MRSTGGPFMDTGTLKGFLQRPSATIVQELLNMSINQLEIMMGLFKGNVI